jgi:hypothetical protein
MSQCSRATSRPKLAIAGADRPHDLLEFGRDRVQRPPDPIVVERRRLDPEDLLHRPGPRPVLHPPQRGRGRSAGWPPAPGSPARGSGWRPPGPGRPGRRCRQGQGAGRSWPPPAAPPAASPHWAGHSGRAADAVVVETPRDARRPQATPAQQPEHVSINTRPTPPHVRRTGLVECQAGGTAWQRNLLYTAVTRAKQLVVLVGSRRALARAVRTHGAGVVTLPSPSGSSRDGRGRLRRSAGLGRPAAAGCGRARGADP